jgi:chemotaxis signal transduction protein
MENNTPMPLTLLLFQESGNDYALNTSKIHEVICRPMVFLPSPLPNCLGSIYFDGSLVPVYPQNPHTPARNQADNIKSIIVFRIFSENRHYWLSFKADEIKGVITVDNDKIFSNQEWPMIQIPFFSKGLFFNRNRPVFILDPLLLLQNQMTNQPNVYETEDQSIII